MTVVGKVQEITKEFDFDLEWRIEDFFSLSKEHYESPRFLFANESWYLSINPNGESRNNSIGYLSAYLYKETSESAISVMYYIGLKTLDGKKAEKVKNTRAYEKISSGYGVPYLLSRSKLSERKSELAPSGILTVVCSLKYSKSTENEDDTTTLKCSYCKSAFLAKYVSSHEKKCLDKPMKCPTCNDAMKLREWFDHECQMAEVTETGKLMNDLEAILKSEEYSDVTIKVKDKEFRLHRSILAGRNPYFRSMFTSDMKESITGIVSVEDCDPDIFESFVHFVYTGQIETLSSDNVSALYVAADKFQEDHLKAKCLSFMKNKISVDSFCDFIVLALRHGEKELLQSATDLFCRKTKEIIQSVAWQTFSKENSTQANELFIKYVDFNSK